MEKRYGLALGGGGGKGGYHIGVWKALRELDIKIHVVSGTSVGALNAAFVAQNDFDQALEVWNNISTEKVIEIDDNFFKEILNLNLKNIGDINIGLYKENLEKLFTNKGLDTSPLMELIHNYIDEDKIRKSNIGYGLVTVSLTDRKPLELFIEDIPEGKLIEYMVASSFLPGFKPIELDGKRFIDGGFYDNVPINMLLKKNVDSVIAVDLKAIGRKKPVKNKNIDIICISPSGDLVKILEFDGEKSKEDLNMGYLDTLKAFNKYEGFSYFLTSTPEIEDCYKKIMNTSLDDIGLVMDMLKIEEIHSRRMFIEKGIPKIAKLFNCSNEDDYDNIFIKIIEYLAEYVGIYRLQPYSYKELVNEIENKIENVEKKEVFLKQRTILKYDVAKLIFKIYNKE